jgi:hypothetical protein
VAAGPYQVFVPECGRHVEVPRLVAGNRIREAAWQHAHDLPRLIVEHQGLADDVTTAAELPLPEPVADIVA